MLRLLRGYSFASVLVLACVVGGGCAGGPERNQYEQLLVTEQAVVSGRLAEVSIGSTKKTKGWGRAAFTADPSVRGVYVLREPKTEQVAAVTAFVKAPWNRPNFPEDLGLKRGKFLGFGFLHKAQQDYKFPTKAFFETNVPGVYVSYVASNNKAMPEAVHRASKPEFVSSYFSPLEKKLSEAMPYATFQVGEGSPSKAIYESIAPYRDMLPEVATLVAQREDVGGRLSRESLAKVNAGWSQEKARFESLAGSYAEQMDRRLDVLGKLSPDLKAALAVPGSPARKRALEVLGEMLPWFQDNAELLKPNGMRALVYESLGRLADADFTKEMYREKLADLPDLLAQADTTYERIDSLADLERETWKFTVFKPIPRDWEFSRAMQPRKSEALPIVTRRLQQQNKPNWVVIERGIAGTYGFAAKPNDVQRYRTLIDGYPSGEPLQVKLDWLLKMRGHKPDSPQIKHWNEWGIALDKLGEELKPLVEAEADRLEAEHLIATATWLRYEGQRALSRLGPPNYRSMVDGETKEVRTSMYTPALFAFDPPLSQRNGGSYILIRRLNEMPWMERGLSRTLGLTYASATELRQAAEAAGAKLGHARIEYRDGDKFLVEADAEPMLTSLNPWSYAMVGYGLLGVSQETRTEGAALREISEANEKEREVLDAEKARIDATDAQLTADFNRFNQQVRSGYDNQSTRNSLLSRQRSLRQAVDSYNARSRIFTEKVKAFNKRVPPYNVRLNQERSEARRELDGELDAVLTDWFTKRLERHEQELRSAGRSPVEVQRELHLAKWMVGLNNKATQGSFASEATGYRAARFEELKNTLWTRGDSRAIAVGVIELYNAAGYSNTDPRKAELVGDVVNRYASQYDPDVLMDELVKHSIRAGHPLHKVAQVAIQKVRGG